MKDNSIITKVPLFLIKGLKKTERKIINPKASNGPLESQNNKPIPAAIKRNSFNIHDVCFPDILQQKNNKTIIRPAKFGLTTPESCISLNEEASILE